MESPARPRKRRKKEDADEREWHKYEKTKLGGGGGAATNTNDAAGHQSQIVTTTTSSSGAGQCGTRNKRKSKKEQKKTKARQADPRVDADGLLFLEDDALAKAKEPSDRLRIDHDELDPAQLEQKAMAVHTMPPRDQQTVRTLALSAPQAYYNDIAMDMRRMHWYRNANQKALPLQRVLEQGFLPIDNLNPEATIACLTRDLQTESQYLSHLRQSQTKQQQQQGGSGGVGGAKRDLSIAKLNMINGVSFHSLNYNRRTPKDVEERMRASAQSERMQRFYEFYAQDRVDIDVDFGAIPSTFPMFQQLQAQYGRKYQAHEAIVQDCAELVPKVEIEVVSREYIRKYRLRPEPGVELCSQGAQCIFNTFSSDRHVGYVGPVFYTPLERKNQAIQACQKGTPLLLHRNPDRLCVDCLWHLWTKTHDRNVSNEVAVDKPMNHFSVECRAGQYSPLMMLTVMENDRPTGISKHVPRFSCNNRQFVALAQHHREEDKLHTVYTPFLAEVGMDF